MVYAESEKNYAYFKIEGSFAEAEDIGTGAGGDGNEKHIPFNILSKFTIPKLKYEDVEWNSFASLEPPIIYSKNFKSETASNEAIYGDPFLLLTIFTQQILIKHSLV